MVVPDLTLTGLFLQSFCLYMRQHAEILSWEEDSYISALRNPIQPMTEGKRLRTCHPCEVCGGVRQPIIFRMNLNRNIPPLHPTPPRHTGDLLSIQEQRGRCLPSWTQFSSFHFQHHVCLLLWATGELETCERKQVGHSWAERVVRSQRGWVWGGGREQVEQKLGEATEV